MGPDLVGGPALSLSASRRFDHLVAGEPPFEDAGGRPPLAAVGEGVDRVIEHRLRGVARQNLVCSDCPQSLDRPPISFDLAFAERDRGLVDFDCEARRLLGFRVNVLHSHRRCPF